MSKIGKEGHRYAASCAVDIRELSDYIRAAMYKLLDEDGVPGCSYITDAAKTTLGNLELINYTTDFMIKHYEEEQSNEQD